MAEGAGEEQVPAGAAVFPLIPAELGVQPLLLAVLHALVFLAGSSEAIVQPAAAEEAIHYLITYLGRLRGRDLERVREDLDVLQRFARQQHWPREQLAFLKNFLRDYGVGRGEEPA
jgi:hypothetical protein